MLTEPPKHPGDYRGRTPRSPPDPSIPPQRGNRGEQKTAQAPKPSLRSTKNTDRRRDQTSQRKPLTKSRQPEPGGGRSPPKTSSRTRSVRTEDPQDEAGGRGGNPPHRTKGRLRSAPRRAKRSSLPTTPSRRRDKREAHRYGPPNAAQTLTKIEGKPTSNENHTRIFLPSNRIWP